MGPLPRASGLAGRTIARQPSRRGSASPHGTVLFVQVDRTANTVTFVTTSGSLVYDLDAPTALPAGSYDFGVTVSGNNVSMTASDATLTAQSNFRYRIHAGQPNPSTLLHGMSHVSVQVIEGTAAAPDRSSTDLTTQLLGANPTTQELPVTFTAVPLGPGPGSPGAGGAAWPRVGGPGAAGDSSLPGLSPFSSGAASGCTTTPQPRRDPGRLRPLAAGRGRLRHLGAVAPFRVAMQRHSCDDQRVGSVPSGRIRGRSPERSRAACGCDPAR